MAKNKKKSGKKKASSTIQNSGTTSVPDLAGSEVVPEVVTKESTGPETQSQSQDDLQENADVDDQIEENPKKDTTTDANRTAVSIADVEAETGEEPNATKNTDKDELINSLNDEIKKLRQELADSQTSSNKIKEEESELNIAAYKEELKKLQNERDEIETKYDTLLTRVSSMKTVFSKMKEAQYELETVQEQLKEYETQNLSLREKIKTLVKDKDELSSSITTLNKEFANLETDYETLQNDYYEKESQLKELEAKYDAERNLHTKKMNEFERQVVQNESRIQELDFLLENKKQDLIDLTSERDELKQLQNKNESIIGELNETVKQLESAIESNTNIFKGDLSQKDLQINSLRLQLDKYVENEKIHKETAVQLNAKLEAFQNEMKSQTKLEEEIKEQQVIIGTLRKENIVTTEHLRKAMGMLKQSSESETVDRELISNLLISFVSIPRADPKKFEVLQLLSNFLNWDDDKKQQAGLVNSANNDNSARPPSSSRTQSFVSLWTDYLEKESER